MMIHKLKNLATDKKVNILFACESGSRAWGFASPDSDYDVRFVYTHPLEWYLSVSEKRDTIDLMEGDFDAVGWELKKKLRLLKKSNVPALEHLFSPITYIEENASIKELRKIAEDCFSPVACMYHYLSMSKKYEEKLSAETVKLKSLFYALRTALAGKWILENNTMPPVVFDKMLSLVKRDEADEIRNLMTIKSENNESYLHSRNEKVINLITGILDVNEKFAKSLSGGKPDTDRIDSFLYNTLTK
jgi:predicted nucleotidyltransferase